MLSAQPIGGIEEEFLSVKSLSLNCGKNSGGKLGLYLGHVCLKEWKKDTLS